MRYLVLALLIVSPMAARCAAIENLTGLPAYPHLTAAAMDDTLHVEALGRWCARFSALSDDSFEAVQNWYRKTLKRASETDLAADPLFRRDQMLFGVKLALDYDYVAVYRSSRQATVIELHRCTWP